MTTAEPSIVSSSSSTSSPTLTSSSSDVHLSLSLSLSEQGQITIHFNLNQITSPISSTTTTPLINPDRPIANGSHPIALKASTEVNEIKQPVPPTVLTRTASEITVVIDNREDDNKSIAARAERAMKPKTFWAIISVLIIIAVCVSPFQSIAPWYGFLVAAYSAVVNDSIQTLGTFLRSNQHRPWPLLFGFVGSIFFGTVLWSYIEFDGDVSHGRLSAEGFDQEPEEVTFGHILGPIVIIILTQYRVPVSTTLLLLSSFATSSSGLGAVLTKSLFGYLLAFLSALIVWAVVESLQRKYAGQFPSDWWYFAQAVSTGSLWSIWVQQNAANVAVMLPRSLDGGSFIAFCVIILVHLAVIIYRGGGEIQEIVARKTNTKDIRSATVIDIVYAVVLYYFKVVSEVPMSTTWVFVGLLAGREISIAAHKSWTAVKGTRFELGRDLLAVVVGLVISLVMAAVVNPVVLDAFLGR